MSEVTRGILNMPRELWMNNEVAAIQVESTMRTACKELDSLREKAAAFDWLEKNQSVEFYQTQGESKSIVYDGLRFIGKDLLEAVNQAMKESAK